MTDRWTLGLRWIPGIDVERAELRTTLAYRFSPELQAGLEYNPLAEDLGVIANWRAWQETEARPALILGTSSDRIGTEDGRSYYATLSKSLEHATGLPVSPYAGVAFGESDDEWSAVGGLVVNWSDDWSTYHVWDGENFHHIVETRIFAPHTFGLMLAQVDDHSYVGFTYSLGFSMPWERK